MTVTATVLDPQLTAGTAGTAERRKKPPKGRRGPTLPTSRHRIIGGSQLPTLTPVLPQSGVLEGDGALV